MCAVSISASISSQEEIVANNPLGPKGCLADTSNATSTIFITITGRYSLLPQLTTLIFLWQRQQSSKKKKKKKILRSDLDAQRGFQSRRISAAAVEKDFGQNMQRQLKPGSSGSKKPVACTSSTTRSMKRMKQSR